ncbi:MAG: hypothetical protein Q7U04_15055 [Bacteriovorax sp.]|nr:hypothetical protein [Bacteriovorax sp.]
MKSYKIDDVSNRNITLNNQGMFQVFSNFPGTTNSNSTGARTYFIFPLRENKKIQEADESHLSIVHPSGVKLEFDKLGRISSPDLKITESKEINSKNKSGVEIDSYSKGIILDFGYKMGGDPMRDRNGILNIIDKNKKKCTLINSDLTKMIKGDAELIYKTNESLHKVLATRCPGLDISDLLVPIKKDLEVVTKPSTIGAVPSVPRNDEQNNSARPDYKISIDDFLELSNQNTKSDGIAK